MNPGPPLRSLGAKFEGVAHFENNADGTVFLVFVTDFSNAACPRQAFDIKTRQRIKTPQGMQFVITPAEGQALGWDKR